MKLPALLATALLLAAPAWAQQHKLAPGLWETEFTVKSDDGKMEAAMAQAQKAMAGMSPEQRAQMEALMKQRGMSMPAGAGQPAKMRHCLTPEQAARDEVPQQNPGECKQTGRTRSGNTFKITMECTGARPAKGEGEFTFVSPKEHKGQMRMTMTRGEQAMTMDTTMHARWIAADCGDVKPRP